jgi:hypothetical protein
MLLFCIYNLTLTVSIGIVNDSAIDAEKDAIKAFLMRKDTGVGF